MFTPRPLHRNHAQIAPFAFQSLTAMLMLIVFLPFATLPLQADERTSPMNPETLYGGDLLFSIWRDGDQIGAHKTRFSRDGDQLIVDTTVKMQVKILFITVYQMDHTIKEIWQNDSLRQLDVWTDDDGDVSAYTAKRQGDKVVVDGPDGTYDAPSSLMTTSHWNRWILDRDKVFNTLTGQLNGIAMAKQGETTVTAGAEQRSAVHYAYTGDLDTDIWFDELGRWVKLKFKAPDGSDIEYICESCGKPGI